MSVFDDLRELFIRKKEVAATSYWQCVSALADEQKAEPKSVELVLQRAGKTIEDLRKHVATAQEVRRLRAFAARAPELLEQERAAFAAHGEFIKQADAARRRAHDESVRLSQAAQRLNRERLRAEDAGRKAAHLAGQLIEGDQREQLEEARRVRAAKQQTHDALVAEIADLEARVARIENPPRRLEDPHAARETLVLFRRQLEDLVGKLPKAQEELAGANEALAELDLELV